VLVSNAPGPGPQGKVGCGVFILQRPDTISYDKIMNGRRLSTPGIDFVVVLCCVIAGIDCSVVIFFLTCSNRVRKRRGEL
jgi:hypothetical protein